jgi:putative membrane protein
MYDFGMHGWVMWLIWIAPLLIIGLILFFAKSSKEELLTPKELLDRRYANGEIDTEEYRERLAELEANAD